MMKPSKKQYHFSKCFGPDAAQRVITTRHMPADALHQPAVFETMIFKNKTLGFKVMHVKRFRESLMTMMPDHQVIYRAVFEWCETLIQQNPIENGIIRLSLTKIHRDLYFAVAHMRPFNGMPESFYKKGVSVSTANYFSNAESAHPHEVKSNDYLTAILSRIGRAESFADDFEQIFMNASGYLTEGSVSNLFLVKKQVIWTPHSSCGILLGVTRGIVCKQIQKYGLDFQETLLTRHQLYNADEVFLTNSSCGVVPVIMCDKRRIGSGQPGPISIKLNKSISRQYKKIGVKNRRKNGS